MYEVQYVLSISTCTLPKVQKYLGCFAWMQFFKFKINVAGIGLDLYSSHLTWDIFWFYDIFSHKKAKNATKRNALQIYHWNKCPKYTDDCSLNPLIQLVFIFWRKPFSESQRLYSDNVWFLLELL